MIKLIDSREYKIIEEWWIAHNWTPVLRELLPNRGYIVYIENIPILAGFLYKDETCGFGMLEWIVSNPEATKEQKDTAFSDLMKFIYTTAEEIGIKVIFTSSKNESLVKRLTDNGFIVAESNVTFLVKGF